MSCNNVKCSKCPNVVKACTLIQGMCPSCYGKQVKANPPKPNNP